MFLTSFALATMPGSTDLKAFVSIENRALKVKIRVLHAASHGIYGSPKIYLDLKDEGIRCGKKRVARIMKEAGLHSRAKKKFKATTQSNHQLPVAPNLLNQNFSVDAPGRIWVGDITYIHTSEGWVYLAVLIDLFNREIVGWSLGPRMTRQLTIDALQMAVGRKSPSRGLIHHTDRGSQYASLDYQKWLNNHGMLCSMSRKGNGYDNAVAESFFSRLKCEWVNHYRYQNRAEAMKSVFYYIEIFYNRKRRHSFANYATPHEKNVFFLAV